MMKTMILILCAACGGATQRPAQHAGSRGPRASDHLEAAQQDDEAAREQIAYPDTRSDGTGRVDSYPSGMAWYRTWNPSVDHARLAQVHRSKAAELQAQYEEACGTRSLAEVSVSPLQKYGIGGAQLVDGVTLYLSPAAGPADRLLADMKCHRAWMMLAPTDMDDCPLDLADIHLAAHGDDTGITVTITVSDRALVPELQRRAAHDLEAKAMH